MIDKTTRILMIDDESIVLQLLSMALKGFGYIKLFKATTSTRAIQILEREKIDVVFLDLQLKEDSGFDVLKKIKKNYKNVDVIILSGHATVKNVKQSIMQGASAFVCKPFSAKKIYDVLEDVSNKEKSDKAGENER